MTSDKYLPGLEGDPSGAVLENWADADWEKWFRSEVESTPDWYDFSGEGGPGRIPRGAPDAEMNEALEAFISGSSDARDIPDDPSNIFKRFSFENKVKFYRGWYRIQASLDVDSGVSETSDSTLVRVKTPGGGKVPWKTILVTGVVVVSLGVGFAIANSGDETDGASGSASSSAEWSVDDVLGDIGPAFDDVSPLEDPDPAGDIAVMGVKAQDGATAVTIRFSGAAKDLSINADQTINAGLLVVLPDGNTIDILFEDGRCKISDASTAGGTISCQWLDDRDLELKIDGWTPVPGTNLTFATYQSSNSALGVSSDTVELETD